MKHMQTARRHIRRSLTAFSRTTLASFLFALSLAAAQANCTPPPPGLVGWWKGEGDGSDVLGNSPGSLLGGTVTSVGKVGQAFQFDGVNDSVRIPAGAAINVGTADGFTVECWINPADVSVRQPIAEWNNGANTWGVHFHVDPLSFGAGPGALYANIVTSSGMWRQLYSPAGTVKPNEFQHVALTYDKASGLARLYCNGVIVAQRSFGSFTPHTTFDLYVGRRPAGPGNEVYAFQGLIDEFSLYNRALSTAEIAAIHAVGTAGKCVPTNPPPPSGPSILAGPITNTANGSIYFLLSSSTWTEAEAKAVALGGHLVTINDAGENDWVFNTFANFGGQTSHLWIGLNDAAQEGAFVWSSGQPITYTRWAPGEPNEFVPGEDYAHINSPVYSSLGNWNDHANSASDSSGHPFRGVVEISPAAPPPPPPVAGGVPRIDSFTPRVARPGDAVEITGANFSATPSDNIVWFGAVRASVVAASVSKLVVQVPPGATYAPPSVTVGGLFAEAPLPFLPTYGSGEDLLAGQFIQQDLMTSSGSLAALSFADLNGTGYPDVIMAAEFGSQNFVLHENLGSGPDGWVGFAEAVPLSTRGSGYRGHAGDVDNDGNPDLVSVTRGPGGNLTVAVRRNLGIPGALSPDSFEPTVSFPVEALTEKVLLADLNGDGKKELVVAAGQRIRVFPGAAAPGSFTTNSVAAPFDLPLGSMPSDIVTGDFDGDGRWDLVVSLPSENRVILFKNLSMTGDFGHASFANSVVFTGVSQSLTAADLNADGRLDLLLDSEANHIVVLLNQTGSPGGLPGMFGAPISVSTGGGPRSIAVGDIDGDGRPDLVVGSSASGMVSVMLNRSSGTLVDTNAFPVAFELPTPQDMLFPFSPPLRVAVADINLDGRADIAVCGRFPGMRLFLNFALPAIASMNPSLLKVNEGTTATFTATVTGTAPLRLQWSFGGVDLPGETNATLQLAGVTYGQAGTYTLTVSNLAGVATTNAVVQVNRAPVASIGATELLLISPNGLNAIAVLDGEASSDPDGDALAFGWFRAGESNAFATTAVAAATLPVGSNALSLVVSDGMTSARRNFVVEVITTAQAVGRLAAAVAAGAPRPQPLLASLRAAMAAIDRSQPAVAANQLQAFQNKVQAQVAPHDPELAAQLIAEAQAIIDALIGGPEPGPVVIEITRIAPGPEGKPSLRIRGKAGRQHIVEVSTNGIAWEPIGLAASRGGDEFEFNDSAAPGAGARFYRVVSPR